MYVNNMFSNFHIVYALYSLILETLLVALCLTSLKFKMVKHCYNFNIISGRLSHLNLSKLFTN